MSFADDHRYLEFPYGDDDDDDYRTDNQLQAAFECYSPAFLTDRERTGIETGGKILLPQAVLEQLIDQTGVMLFKLSNRKNNRVTHCGVLEFLSRDQACCYVPYWMMRHLLLNESDQIHVESVPYLPPATFARFQPRSSDFLEISNPKAVLEKVLRSFSCLTRGDVITINYLNRNYELAVLELKPADAVCIIECDMEVDFAPHADAIEPKSLPTTVPDQQLSKSSSSAFTAFHGQGNRLNAKSKPTDQRDQPHVETSQARGRPNYDYQYGLLQFPRAALRPLNNETNEVVDKNAADIFRPFAGEGRALRQLRDQQPK